MSWFSKDSRAANPSNKRIDRTQASENASSSRAKKGRKAKQRKGPQLNILKTLRNSLSGEWLATWNKRGHLPFFAFLGVLFVLYISLVYRYESNERAKRDATREMLDLSNTHKSLLSEFETQLQRSKLDDEMADVGIIQPASPPQILIEQ